MTMRTDLTWLEELLESHYGFAATVELRERLSTVWSNPREMGANSRGEQLRRVVESLVVGETYFFRELPQIEYVVRKFVVDRLADPRLPRTLRVLSAGCASGEEAYSLAIALEMHGGGMAHHVSIVGIDVSSSAIQKAKRAVYSAWSLRALPESLRDKYFCRRGDEYQLDDRFRARVRFEERNLFEVDAEFWAGGAFDVIFCRNVAIYFSTRALRDLATRFAYVLTPGGCLFMGHSETLRGLSDDFDLVHDSNVFYYCRKGGIAVPVALSPPVPPALPSPRLADNSSHVPIVVDAPAVDVAHAPTFHAVESSARHFGTLTNRETDMIRKRIVSLVEIERFDEAWALLGQLPSQAHTTLLTAIICLAKGWFEDAERACHELFSSGEYEADAHCLLGSCREHQRAYDSAERHYRQATRLDGRFAMPYLRLGLLLARSGDTARGSAELARAVERLECESPERIAFFGGGFSRKVLLELCQERLAVRTIAT